MTPSLPPPRNLTERVLDVTSTLPEPYATGFFLSCFALLVVGVLTIVNLLGIALI